MIPFGAEEISNYMTQLLSNSSRWKTSWLCTKHDIRLQPRSQEEAGQSQTTDIRIANHALRLSSVFFDIIRNQRCIRLTHFWKFSLKSVVTNRSTWNAQIPQIFLYRSTTRRRKICFRNIKLWNSLDLSLKWKRILAEFKRRSRKFDSNFFKDHLILISF